MPPKAVVISLASVTANLLPSLIEVPVEVTKNRLQAHTFGPGTTFLGAMRLAVAAGGVPALFTGFAPFLLKQARRDTGACGP